MKKPKICFVNPPVLLKRPISEIIHKLSQKEYKTSLLIPKKAFQKIDSSLHHSKLVSKSRIYTYSIINPPFISAEQPIPVTPMFCINTIKAMKNNDIIHMWVPYYLTSFWIILTKRLFFPKKKLILTMDTVPGYSFSMGGFWNLAFRVYNKLFGWLLFGTPKNIVLYGKSMIPYALKAGVSKKKLKVIPTGIDVKTSKSEKSEKKTSSIRKELGIGQKTKIVLYAGLIIPRKGIDKIIRIAGRLRKENIVFLLAGDGPKRKEYEKQVKEKNMDKKVFFLGWRKDMHTLYQAADVFLLPAEGEGLPGVVMEAMAYGIPCVASNIPCIPDLIDNGKNGFLCGKSNISSFSDKIKLLARRNGLAERMGTDARIKIKKFEWIKIIRSYEELYTRLSK